MENSLSKIKELSDTENNEYKKLVDESIKGLKILEEIASIPEINEYTKRNEINASFLEFIDTGYYYVGLITYVRIKNGKVFFVDLRDYTGSMGDINVKNIDENLIKYYLSRSRYKPYEIFAKINTIHPEIHMDREYEQEDVLALTLSKVALVGKEKILINILEDITAKNERH